MKVKVLIIICICTILCGCKKEDKYKDYEHYDLTNQEKITFNYMEEDGILQEYVFSEIPNSVTTMEYPLGIFYKLNANDYILLNSTFSNSNPSPIFKDGNHQYTYFYNNKVYIRTTTIGLDLTEFTLNKDKIEKREISFDISNITTASHISCSNIKEVDENRINFNGCYYFEDSPKYNISLECSLETYKCEKNVE